MRSFLLVFFLGWGTSVAAEDFSTSFNTMCSGQGCDYQLLSIECRVGSDTHVAALHYAIKKPFLLESLTFDSDVHISQVEFDYLIGISQGQMVTADQISNGVAYLFKKNKFQNIIVNINPGTEGNKIHLQMSGFWTFKKLKFHGFLIGKESYRHYYTMNPCEPFDMKKHELALKKIEQAFKNEGYFNAVVDSYFDYDATTKQVVVHITLRRNERYGIGSTTFDIYNNTLMTPHEKDLLLVDVQKHFLKRLIHSSYSKAFINKETRALKHALAKKGFIHVTIGLAEKVNHNTNKVDLSFTLEVHHKKEFKFYGNSFFSCDQLLNAILDFGHSASLLPASILSEEIVLAYQNKGFWQVDVQAIEEGNCYSFKISEGSRSLVKKVILKNHPNDEVTVVGWEKCFFDVIAKKFYDEDTIKIACDMLTNLYLKHGYWDMKILKRECVSSLEDGLADVVMVTVHEGIRSFVKSISIEGHQELENQGPFANYRKAGGIIPFDMTVLQEQREWLLEYFHKKGFAMVDVKPDIQRTQENVEIIWKVNLQQADVRFGKTIVVGSNQFPFEYIQRELIYKYGDIWDKNALKQSFLNLKDLEIFENIHFSPDQTNNIVHEKDIVLKLQPDDPFELRLRAGLEMQDFTQQFSIAGLTYRLGGAFIIKNPGNLGDQLKLDLDFARAHREVVAKYTLPWLSSHKIKTEYQLYSTKYLQPGFVGSKQNIYALTQNGFLFGLTKSFKVIDSGLNVGFEWMSTAIQDRSNHMCALIESIARAIDFDRHLLERQVPYFNIEPTIMIDLLDQKVNPTHGSFTVLSLKGMFPLHRFDDITYFVKALAEQSFFASLRSMVMALRLRIGHIFHRKFNEIMPSERFYLGGANSIRSYDTDFAPPIGSYVDECKIRFAPQGGKTMVNVNAELRFPLYKRLGAVIFQDLGVLSSNAFADFCPRNILAGTGFGVRVATPIGPLRFDMGWDWKKHPPLTRSFAWFLTFGNAF